MPNLEPELRDALKARGARLVSFDRTAPRHVVIAYQAGPAYFTAKSTPAPRVLKAIDGRLYDDLLRQVDLQLERTKTALPPGAVVLTSGQADALQRLIAAATAICPRRPPPFDSDEETITRWHASFRTSMLLVEQLAARLQDAVRVGAATAVERGTCAHSIVVEQGDKKTCGQCGQSLS